MPRRGFQRLPATGISSRAISWWGESGCGWSIGSVPGARQSAYDYFVFALRSRFPRGLAERIAEAVTAPGEFYGKLPVSWREIGHEPSPAALRDSLALFLLEELHWNLEENAKTNFFRESGAWMLFRHEMWPALRALAA